MYKAIHHNGKQALLNVSSYLKRHDIVYKRPALKAYDGLPMGSGSMGGLLFHTFDSVSMQINHTDVIDFVEDGPMKAWAWEAEEKSTAPAALGKLAISCSLPCFDWVYLKEYEERLNLGDGCIEGRAKTPFSMVEWKAYSLEEPEALIFEIKAEFTEEISWNIRAERWPSPVFFHHYEQIVPVYEKNLDTVSAAMIGENLILGQNLGRCRAAMGIAVEDMNENNPIAPELLHSRGGEFHTEKKKSHWFRVIVNAAAEEVKAGEILNAAEHCNLALNAVLKKTDTIRECKESWHRFWEKSFVHLQGEDYLENLYYLYLYQLNCCSRGRYPITFAGLWNWFKDTRNWGHFYHWNHQQTYWPVLAAGHPRLYRNYLDYRWKMLPHAREDARRLFGADGAFFSDVSNLNGYNAIEPDTIRNCSVGAQIAMDFYRYYRYTGDEVFRIERAVPMLCASADFYGSMLEEKDGRFRVKGGASSYESYWDLRETLTDYAALKSVLRILGTMEDIPSEKQEFYRTIEEKLYAPPTELIEDNGKVTRIYAAGVKWDGMPVHYDEGEYPYSPFPASLMSLVYPSGCISLSDEGTEAFQIMKNTARVLLDREIYHLGKLGCSGHAPAPEMAARLGMKDDMIKILKKYVASYQIFPNGFMHFADISQDQQWSAVDRPRILTGNEAYTQWEELHEKKKGVRTEISSEWFLHCYFEASANLAAGIQEMLLQNVGGILRVFPAYPETENGMFRLWAEGGFVVTSEAAEGEVRYVEIFCEHSGHCKLMLPWKEAVTVRVMGKESEIGIEAEGVSINKGIISFPCEEKERYLIFRSEFPPECFYHNPFEEKRNTGIKQMEAAKLGMERYY